MLCGCRSFKLIYRRIQSYPTRPGIWYKFHGDRANRHLRTTPDSMSLRNHLNVRPRSREFIEAWVLRLLMDTSYHHAEACVHCVAVSPSVRPRSPGRDLEVTRSRPNCHAPPKYTTNPQGMSSYIHHQSPPAPLFAGCPRRPSLRSAPRGLINHHLLRDHQDTFRPECPSV